MTPLVKDGRLAHVIAAKESRSLMILHYQRKEGYKRNLTYNESITSADASVEVPKLRNIKLLIASFYTHIDYNYHDEHF